MKKPSLLRLRLYRLRDDEYQFIWIHHHSLMDGWCRPLLLRELFDLYLRYCQGGAPAASESRPARYADYIDWLSRRPAASAERFWRSYLAACGPTLLFNDP